MSFPSVRLSTLLVDVQPGFASGKKLDKGCLQVRMNNVEPDGSWNWSKERRVPITEKQRSRYLLKSNDILFNTTNSPKLAGKSALYKGLSEEVAFSNHFLRLRVNEDKLDAGFLTRYFAYLWQLRIFENMVDAWVNQATVKREEFLNLKIPLPPLKEQKRIATILDKADAIRRKRQQAIDLTDQLLRSVFLDMFGDPVTNPKGWDILPLSTLVSSLEGGKNVKPDESGSETTNRILKVSAVTSGVFKPAKSKPLPDNFNPPDYYYVKKGDLLISRANTAELIGATAFVHESHENLILPDKIWRMKWADSNCVHPLYVHYLFQQASIRREISIRSSGTSGSMKNIPKPKLLEIPIPIPSTDEQKKFGEIAEKIYSTHNLFGGYEKGANDLFNSLTQQAFNGQLRKQTQAA
ncbi:restriction endonuclease subunit S [Beggiatoa alba]|nr:restriction endonuclease subunit S [Beggiatoa alba]